MDINKVLKSNRSKNFVDRIINRNKYPSLDLGNGNYATHKMSWGTYSDNNIPIVYPNIVWKDNKLIELQPKEAFDYAIKNNEFIEFNSTLDADWFSKNYKQYWKIQDEINSMNKVLNR